MASATSGTRLPLPVTVALVKHALAPWRWLTSPHVYGIENVPTDRPAVFVGNHTLMGVLDVPIMLLELHDRLGIWPRPVGDHRHFSVPVWRDLLRALGTVDGTRQVCAGLLRAGESLLVFPGGAREVFKRRGEGYRLLWADRVGFARLAIEHGCPIVPFAGVGAEECYDILVDAGDVLRFAPVLRRIPRAEEVPPLVRGLGPTLLPRPERFYFQFGTPIETEHLAGRADETCVTVRNQVRAAVETGIAFLLAQRDRDPTRSLWKRLTAA